VTIVGMSYTTIEAIYAADYLKTQNISAEVLELRSLRPIDWDAIASSLKKTRRLLVLDTGHLTGGIAEKSSRVWRQIIGRILPARRAG